MKLSILDPERMVPRRTAQRRRGDPLTSEPEGTSPGETRIGYGYPCMRVCQMRDMSLADLHEERDRLKDRLRAAQIVTGGP